MYMLGRTRTNKGFKVRIENEYRVYRFEFVSNQDINAGEYHQWLVTNIQAKQPFPTRQHVEQKKADIEEAMNYEFNDQDIERIIKEKERFKQNPRNFAMEKRRLAEERELARTNGDIHRANELEMRLFELEQRASELDMVRTSTITSIAYINDRNRRRNTEEAEKAIREEHAASNGRKVYDPFTRRSTKPTMTLRHAEESLPELVPEMAPPAPRVVPKPPPQPSTVENNDLFEAHDFELNLDIKIDPQPALPESEMRLILKIAIFFLTKSEGN
ncbi:RNA polymerase-associated protein Rtf1-like [Harmonia axyridis]|uniref:RNA polymerase-associated protein Rtf1-like n=1 Tax=Harmonia axyridis TaxID=115357 RepID=UPI001E27834D|nr:RNA polymerase-associated protein Rtf1-like [Harmonia axyridis]